MILVHFLFMQAQWDRFLPAVPTVGQRVSFEPIQKIIQPEYEVTFVHWFEDGSLVGDNPEYLKMTPYVSLRVPPPGTVVHSP